MPTGQDNCHETEFNKMKKRNTDLLDVPGTRKLHYFFKIVKCDWLRTVGEINGTEH